MIGESLSEQLAQECINSARQFGIAPEIFPATHGDDIEKHFKEHDLKIFNAHLSKAVKSSDENMVILKEEYDNWRGDIPSIDEVLEIGFQI